MIKFSKISQKKKSRAEMHTLTCVKLATTIRPPVVRGRLKSFTMQFPKISIKILCCIHRLAYARSHYAQLGSAFVLFLFHVSMIFLFLVHLGDSRKHKICDIIFELGLIF